jgi:hypothetical protein
MFYTVNKETKAVHNIPMEEQGEDEVKLLLIHGLCS